MSEKMIVACPECETRFVAPLEKFLPAGRKVRCAKCGYSWFHHIEGQGTVDGHTPEQPVAAAVETPREKPVETPTESIIDRAARAKENQMPAMNESRPSTPSSHAPSSIPTAAVTAAGVAAAGTGAAAIATTASATNFDEGDSPPAYDDTSPYADDPHAISAETPDKKRRFWPRAIFYTIAAALIAGAVGYFFKDKISATVPALDPPLTSWKGTVDNIVSTTVPSYQALKIENVRYDLSNTNNEPLMLLTATVTNESGSTQKTPTLTATIYDDNNVVLKTVSVSPEEPVSEIEAQTSVDYFLRLPSPPAKLERVEVDFSK